MLINCSVLEDEVQYVLNPFWTVVMIEGSAVTFGPGGPITPCAPGSPSGPVTPGLP